MTTVYQCDVQGVGTHVLIVGVGSYPHLAGGAGGGAGAVFASMGQLTSASVSASALLTWFLRPLVQANWTEGFHNPDAPLASVEALISATTGVVTVEAPASAANAAQGQVSLDKPTQQNIRTAFKRWLNKLCTTQGSTGIVYFCGHGLATSELFLCCEDVFEDNDRPYENVFSLESTIAGVRKRASGCHLHFWIDACRKEDQELLARVSKPLGLLDVNLMDQTVYKSCSVIYASSPSQQAFAKRRGLSRFSSALLKALSGFSGSRSGNGGWCVRAEDLATSVRIFLSQESKKKSNAQHCATEQQGDGVPFLCLVAPPKVVLSLGLDPAVRRPVGLIVVEGLNSNVNDVHLCASGVYTKEVPSGVYRIEASATDASFARSVLEYEVLSPPQYSRIFLV